MQECRKKDIQNVEARPGDARASWGMAGRVGKPCASATRTTRRQTKVNVRQMITLEPICLFLRLDMVESPGTISFESEVPSPNE